MPSRSTSSTEPESPGPEPSHPDRPVALSRPVLGRPSPAAGAEPSLRPAGDSATAAWRADGASTAWCTLRAASVAGIRHRLSGRGSEDSYAWAHDGRVVVVAVADGVGSVPGSAAAAERACRAAVDAALRAAREALTAGEGGGPAGAGLAAGWAEEAVRAAVEEANRASEGGGATTLVVAVITHDGDSAVGRVGDSSAWSLAPGSGAGELFDPPDEERVDTATDALPSPSVRPEVRGFAAGPGALLVLVTDGLADPWRDGPTTVAPALTASLLECPEPLELLSLADFSRQGCHDDRTLVGVWVR